MNIQIQSGRPSPGAAGRLLGPEAARLIDRTTMNGHRTGGLKKGEDGLIGDLRNGGSEGGRWMGDAMEATMGAFTPK